MGGCFYVFGQIYQAMGANPTSHFFGPVFLKTILNPACLEPLIDFVAYVHIWSQNYGPQSKIL